MDTQARLPDIRSDSGFRRTQSSMQARRRGPQATPDRINL